MNNEVKTYGIDVKAEVRYLAGESDLPRKQHVFAYTITISNVGEVSAKLLTRHWFITDADGHVQEVKGEGVIGEQPHLKPGENFRYTSFAVLTTPVGSMHGSYQMIADDGHHFEAPISAFSLAMPAILH